MAARNTYHSLPLLFMIYYEDGTEGLTNVTNYCCSFYARRYDDRHPYLAVIESLELADIDVWTYEPTPERPASDSTEPLVCLADDDEASDSDSSVSSLERMFEEAYDDPTEPAARPFIPPITEPSQGAVIRGIITNSWPDRDYGLGPESSANNRKWRNEVASLVSAQFADKPGFGMPLTDIDAVTFVEDVVFFQRGSSHYVYNWSLTPSSAIWNTMGMALAPFQHHKNHESAILTYFQLGLPFVPDCVSYHRDFVYMQAGLVHHILTSCDNTKCAPSFPSWSYFQLDGITPDCIHIMGNSGSFYVHHGSTLYQYLSVTRNIESIIRDNDQIYLLRAPDEMRTDVLCRTTGNTLVDYSNSKLQYAMLEDGEMPVGVCFIKQSARMLLISSPQQSPFFVRGSTFCINTHGTITNQVFSVYGNIEYVTGGVILVSDAGKITICTLDSVWDTDGFKRVGTYQVDNHTYCIYEPTVLPEPVDDVHVQEGAGDNNSYVLVRAVNHFYRYKLTERGLGPCEEITLRPESSTTNLIIKALINRPQCDGNRVAVNIETYASRLERLALVAEMFGVHHTYSVSIDRQSKAISYGKGVKRVFVCDALAQFASTYLTQHNALTSFNLVAFDGITAPQLFAYGRMLHLAIAMTKQQLSIRLPLALLTALQGSEPTIDELEYFALKESPETFESMRPYRHDPSGLADCGYDSYQECLEHAVHYSTSQPRLTDICATLAAGITSLMPIKNLKLMNMPTIDYYLSGPYYIDRQRFKSMIRYSNDECEHIMVEVIDGLTEEQLAILLMNWSGTTVVMDKQYHVSADTNLEFSTCGLSLSLPRTMLQDLATHRATLIEMLTTPINYIKD